MLADMVTFGVATPFLVYIWALTGLGKIGWLVAFLFVAATALQKAKATGPAKQLRSTVGRAARILTAPERDIGGVQAGCRISEFLHTSQIMHELAGGQESMANHVAKLIETVA